MWSVASTGTDAEEQVTTANRLEALAARAGALVHTPRLLQNAALADGVHELHQDRAAEASCSTRTTTTSSTYQGDRDGFWSRIVARLDGYDMRPTLQLVTA